MSPTAGNLLFLQDLFQRGFWVLLILISSCVDRPSAQSEYLGHTSQDFTSVPVHGQRGNPLSMCLVGIPLVADDWPITNLDLLHTTGKRPNPVDAWDEWTKTLPHAIEEPQELDLLVSSKATYCQILL